MALNCDDLLAVARQMHENRTPAQRQQMLQTFLTLNPHYELVSEDGKPRLQPRKPADNIAHVYDLPQRDGSHTTLHLASNTLLAHANGPPSSTRPQTRRSTNQAQ